MKTALRMLLLLLVAIPAGSLTAAPPDTPTSGKFLVLRNGRTLEGDIQLVDDLNSASVYRVRRNGGETLIPANQVLRLFPDTEAAYQFLRTKENLKDPDARLQLARWCLEFNLRKQAEEEASVALVLRPGDPEIKELLQRIQQPPAVASQPPVKPAPAPEEPPVAIDMTAEALGQFTHKVQPILINACASCHAAGRSGSFILKRPSDVPLLNHQANQHNLAAVLGQINYVQLAASPLLTKAVTVHGGSDQAALKGGRQSIPYQTLEEWLRMTIATNPQLSQHAGITAVPPPPPAPTQHPSAFAAAKTVAAPPTVGELSVAPPPPSPAAKPMESTSGDPFDPSEFNRQAHPEHEPAPKP
jgi:hypothetical protein